MKAGIAMLLAGAAMVAAAAVGGCNGASNSLVDKISFAQPTAGESGVTVKQITNSAGQMRNYGLFIPASYTPTKKYPVIVFLHGIGEAGSDPHSCMRVGLGPYVGDHADSFPFIVIFPQSTGGWSANSQAADDCVAILHQVEHDYSVDRNCVSLTGVSTGGYGTFAIGAKYPNEFTALAPMCPASADLSDGSTLARMNIWAFENAADPFVAPLSMASTLTTIKASGGNPKHTVFVGAGHDCWEKAYSEGEVFEWMKAQRRDGVAAIPEQSAEPRTYGYVPPTPVAAAPRVSAPYIPAARSVPTMVPPAEAQNEYMPPVQSPARTSADDRALIPTPY